MDVKYIQSIMDRRKGAKASSSGKITTDYVQGVLNSRNTVNTSTQSVSASQTMPKPSVAGNRNSVPTTTALLDAVTNPMPKLDIKAPDRIKAPGTDSTQYRGHGFISQHELEDRGNAINSANASITLANMLGAMSVAGSQALYKDEMQRQVEEQMDRTGQHGTFNRDRLTEQFMEENPYVAPDNSDLEKWKTEQEAILAEARDLSKYSDEEIARAYENTDNYNIFERIFDFGTKNDALYTMKQLMNPTYNQYTREQTLQQLMESDKYKEFEGRFIPTSEAYVEFVNSLPTEQQFTRTQESLQREWAEANGYSYDDLKLLADGIISGDVTENIKRTSEEMPILSSALSPAFNVVGGMQGSLYGLTNAITGEPIAYDSNNFAAQKGAETIRETVSEQIDNPLGEFAYNTGMSIADSLLSQAVGGGKLGTTIMGMSAYSATLQDGAERGLTPAQMQTTALASGAAEYVFEKISWDKINLIARGQASPNILANIASQMATEGAEEGLTEIANIIVDDLVNGGASEMAQLKEFYLSQGMSEEEAEQKVFLEYAKQIGLSVAGGALSGGVTGGTASAYNRITGNNPNTVTEQNNRTEQGVNTDTTLLQASGESLNGNTENTALTDKMTENNKESYRVPNALENSNPSADVQNVHEFSSSADSISDSAENDNDGFIPTTYQSGNGIDAYDEHTSTNLTSSKGVTSNNVNYSDFVKASLQNKNLKQTYYFGKVSDELADDIFESTGLELDGFNITVPSDNINHSLKEHSDEKKEQAKGQIALNEELLSRLPEVYNNPDKIKLSDHKDERGRDVITFEKRINGIIVVADAISNGRNRLALDTMFIKNSHPTRPDANSPRALRPKRSVGKATFDSSIPNSTENVNKPTGRTMAEDTGIRNTSSTVAELEGKVRGYNESIVSKSDLPTEIKNEFINNPQFYEVLSNKTTLENANEILENSDSRSAIAQFNRLVDQKNPVAVPLGYNLAKQLQQEGRFEEAVEVLRKMSEKLTEAGQFTQAAAITLMHGDPTTALQYLTREIDRMNTKGREKYGKKWTDFELTEAEQQELSALDVGDEQGIKNVYEKVFTRIRQQYPATMREKVTELRRISMLLNMRTNVRNVVSNALLMPVRWTSDRVSALGQGVMHLIRPTFQSTQALYVNRQSKELAKEAWNTVKDTLLEDGKYEDVNGAIRDKQVFKGSKIAQAFDNITNGALTKANDFLGKKSEPSLLETARNFTYWLLKQGDDVFVKKNFESRMASYLSAQKITDLDSIPADAYTLATQEALKATFKDDNALTKMFSAVKRNTGLVGEVILPFTKTPANLAMRGYDYSIGGYIDFFRMMSNSKSRTWDDVISTMDSLSKSVVGTGAIALGFALAAAGFITGPLSDDEDEAAFQKSQGMLPYSLHIGDNYYTYDWAQPAAIPLILGATIYNSTKESDSLWNGIYQGSLAAVDSWFSLSPLQNVQEIFGGYGTPAENIADTFLEAPLSFIPAQVGALARTADTTQRVTYSNGNPLDTLANSAISRIPFLSQSLPAAYDTWGNEIQRSDTTGEAAFAQLLNPGQLGNSNVTPIDDEITRLYDSTGNSAVFPQKVKWNYKVAGGESIKLDNEQYSELQRIAGQTSYALAEELIGSDMYEQLTDEERVSILSSMYSLAVDSAKHDVLGTDISSTNSKLYDVYQEGGAEALINYMLIKKISNSNSATDLIPVLESTNFSTDEKGYLLSQMVGNISNGATTALNDYGNTGLYTYYSLYEEAANVNPENDNSSQSDYLTALYSSGLSNEERGYYFEQLNGGINSGAENAKGLWGYEGVYDYYAYRNVADNGGTNPTQEEMTGFLSAQPNLTQSEKANWFDIYFPTAKENPFRQGSTGNTITGNTITVDYVNEVINNRNK